MTPEKRIRLHLPYPPSINHYYVRTRRGMAIGKKGKAYREAVWWGCALKSGITKPLTGSLRIALKVMLPDRRMRDLDNIQKCLLDALEHAGVVANDNQFRSILTEAVGVEKPGWVDVVIEPMGDEGCLST